METGIRIAGRRGILQANSAAKAFPIEGFPKTEWPLVSRAGRGDFEDKRKALEALLIRYLPLLKRYVLWHFHATESDATDWLHDFVFKRVLQRDLIATADPTRGKFRTYLLRSLDNFVIEQLRKETCLKRSPRGGTVPLDAVPEEALDRAAPDLADAPSDVDWARTLLAEAVGRTQAYCDKTGQQQTWALFEMRVLRPILDGTPPPPYQEITATFGFASPLQACNALTTAKRIFARSLRSVVASYASSEESVEEELRELREILLKDLTS